MTVGFVYPYCFPSVGGVETFLQNLAETFSRKGVDVIIFTSEKHSAPQSNDIKIVYLKPKKLFGYDVPSKTDIEKVLRENPVDILHYHIPHPYCTIFALTARKQKIPSVATYHADVHPSSALKKIGAVLDRQLCRFIYNAIITTTGWYARRVARFFPAQKVSSIAPGIDSFFCETHHEKVHRAGVLFVGGMDENHRYKGLPILLKAATKTPGIPYTLIGGGNKKQDFEEMAKNLGLQNVTFAGSVSKEQLRTAYQKTAALVLPSTSTSEGYGMVLLEAMACGTPIITTDQVGSHEEMERNKAAVIVPANNPEELAKAIIHVTSHDEFAKKLQEQGTIFAQNHSWDNVATETLHVYEHLLKKTER